MSYLFLTPAPKAGFIVVGCAVWAAAGGINLVRVPQTKPMQQFPPNFRDILTTKDLELIRFWAVFSNNCSLGNTFSDVWVLNLVGIPQTKPMQRFPPNFKDMLTTKDLELIRLWAVSSSNT